MKTLSFEQMEGIEGGTKAGCSQKTTQAIAVIGLVSGVLAFIPVVGWAIFGPTAVGMSIAGTVCAFKG